ncbi:hypothetical protein DFH09DRAFT_1322584 [Mycena vulgaris]|nr:hypothetical protein DFH09DRAFT_1322584 [Mycena vulgaris]
MPDIAICAHITPGFRQFARTYTMGFRLRLGWARGFPLRAASCSNVSAQTLARRRRQAPLVRALHHPARHGPAGSIRAARRSSASYRTDLPTPGTEPVRCRLPAAPLLRALQTPGVAVAPMYRNAPRSSASRRPDLPALAPTYLRSTGQPLVDAPYDCSPFLVGMHEPHPWHSQLPLPLSPPRPRPPSVCAASGGGCDTAPSSCTTLHQARRSLLPAFFHANPPADVSLAVRRRASGGAVMSSYSSINQTRELGFQACAVVRCGAVIYFGRAIAGLRARCAQSHSLLTYRRAQTLTFVCALTRVHPLPLALFPPPPPLTRDVDRSHQPPGPRFPPRRGDPFVVALVLPRSFYGVAEAHCASGFQVSYTTPFGDQHYVVRQLQGRGATRRSLGTYAPRLQSLIQTQKPVA